MSIGDWYIGDSWDGEKSLKDSPQRFEEPLKTEQDLKIEELEARILALEKK